MSTLRERWVIDQRKGYGSDRCGKESTVYASGAVRFLKRSVGVCRGCGGAKELVNGYCEVCRALGANEAQCLKDSER